MNCGDISKNLTLASCGNSSAGLEADLVLANFADIDRSSCEVDGNVCAEFVMTGSTKCYRYTSHKNAFESDCTLLKGTYRNLFDHKLVCRVFAKTQDAKDELIKLANGKIVAIAKNLDSNNEATKYEIFGWDSGLVMTDFQAASTDGDGIVYTFTLASDDNAKEGQLPLSYFAGTLAATETALAALVATP